MAIARKPAPVSERTVEAVINKGGHVPTPARSASARSSRTPVIVRLDPDLLARVDAAVADRPVPITRHSWILEALHEKALRESC